MTADGTALGYRKHHRDGTPTCQPCRDAYNQAAREYRATYPKRDGRPRRHGTLYSLRWHKLSGAPVCDPCLDLQCVLEAARVARYLARYTDRTRQLSTEAAA